MDEFGEDVRTDYDYEPYGDPENWTWEGMKVYHYGWEFNSNLDFVETFCTEDGRDWMEVTPKEKWSPDMWKKAAQGNYI